MRPTQSRDKLGARVVSINRRQIAAARNAGARAARGEFLFFVDADTRIAPGHVTRALEALAEGCSGGSARVAIDSDCRFGAKFSSAFSLRFILPSEDSARARSFLPVAQSFEMVGGFDEQYFAGEEVYLTLALKKLGRFKILREPIVTSGRKLRMHSPGFVLAQILFLLLADQPRFAQRDKLALWYDGKRETRAELTKRLSALARRFRGKTRSMETKVQAGNQPG